MQMQVQISDTQDCGNEKNAHDDHQVIRLARPGQVERKVMRCHRMKLIAQFSSSPVLRSAHCNTADAKIASAITPLLIWINSLRHPPGVPPPVTSSNDSN